MDSRSYRLGYVYARGLRGAVGGLTKVATTDSSAVESPSPFRTLLTRHIAITAYITSMSVKAAGRLRVSVCRAIRSTAKSGAAALARISLTEVSDPSRL